MRAGAFLIKGYLEGSPARCHCGGYDGSSVTQKTFDYDDTLISDSHPPKW